MCTPIMQYKYSITMTYSLRNNMDYVRCNACNIQQKLVAAVAAKY